MKLTQTDKTKWAQTAITNTIKPDPAFIDKAETFLHKVYDKQVKTIFGDSLDTHPDIWRFVRTNNYTHIHVLPTGSNTPLDDLMYFTGRPTSPYRANNMYHYGSTEKAIETMIGFSENIMNLRSRDKYIIEPYGRFQVKLDREDQKEYEELLTKAKTETQAAKKKAILIVESIKSINTDKQLKDNFPGIYAHIPKEIHEKQLRQIVNRRQAPKAKNSQLEAQKREYEALEIELHKSAFIASTKTDSQ